MNAPLRPSDRHAAARMRASLLAIQHVSGEMARGLPADVALGSFYREHPQFGSRDRRQTSEAVFAWFRWFGWTGAQEGEPGPVTLETRMERALWLDAQTSGVEKLAREFQSHFRLPRCPPLTALVPDWVPDVMEWSDATAQAWQRRPATWLRASAGELEDVRAWLQEEELLLSAHPRLPGALSAKPSGAIQEFIKRHPRAAEIQNPASQAVGIICAPAEGQSWWDVCAGSGGKSLHLLDLARGQLDLLATDTRDKALKELQRRQQGRRFAFRNLNAETDALPDTPFDGVLVDAPCSGFGTWARNPDARWRTDSDDVTHLAGVQTLILGRASAAVKAGGALVYSVCTLTRAETTGVVRAFLADHPDFQPEAFVNPLDGAPCDGTLLLPPERASGDGMYIARFRRR